MSGRQAFNSPQSYQRPSQQDLGSFLNMPQGSKTTNSAPARIAPHTAAAQQPTGGGTKSYTTERGGTITVGGASGSGVTGSGTTVGGASAESKSKPRADRRLAKFPAWPAPPTVRIQRFAKKPNGHQRWSRKRGGQRSRRLRRLVGLSPRGLRHSRRESVRLHSSQCTGGYGYGNGTGQIGSVSAVRGPAGNVISAGHGASFVNGQFVGGRTSSAGNGAYTHWNCFGPGWVNNYPNYWWPGKWAVATTAWATATYAMAGGYCGCSSEGTYYDYGENVTYQDGTVYQDGQPVASQDEYYNQAEQIAASGKETNGEDWMPLGVFALVDDGQTKTDKVAQLALDKEGVIRGNFHDILADTVTPITGAVDKAQQHRAQVRGERQASRRNGLVQLDQ